MALISFNLPSLNTLIYRGHLRYSRGLVGFQPQLDDNVRRLLRMTEGGSLLDGFVPRSVGRRGDRSVSQESEFHHRLDGRFEYFGHDLHYRRSLEVHFR